MKRSYKRIIGSRLIVTALAVLIQLTWLWGLLEFLAPYALPINIVLTVLAVLFVLYVASKRDEPAYKILWLICILAFPLFGAILYLGFGDKKPAARCTAAWKRPLPRSGRRRQRQTRPTNWSRNRLIWHRYSTTPPG